MHPPSSADKERCVREELERRSLLEMLYEGLKQEPGLRGRCTLVVSMATKAVRLSVVSLAATALALSSAETIAARDAAPPKRIGPIATIASGARWRLAGWRSTAGIALSYRAAGDNGDWYWIKPGDGTSFSAWLSPTGSLGKLTRVIGAVTPTVARVDVKLSDGRVFSA